MNEEAVLARARSAGLAVDWTDAMGRPQRVRTESLRRLLDALDGIDAPAGLPPLVTGRLGRPITIAGIEGDHAAELAVEGGNAKSVVLRDGALPGIRRSGYHRLRFADREVTLAVAPSRCVTLQDIGGGERLWGVAGQGYSLGRARDGGRRASPTGACCSWTSCPSSSDRRSRRCDSRSRTVRSRSPGPQCRRSPSCPRCGTSATATCAVESWPPIAPPRARPTSRRCSALAAAPGADFVMPARS